MVKKNSIPERWRNLSSVGQRLPGSRFIAFKVPLKGVINQRVTQIQKFTPKDLLSAIRNMNEELGLVIDLTNTERYYTIKDLPKSVQYVKMHTAGLKIPDDSTIHQFKRIVRRFIWNNSENDKLIGVHCTTGINRTGYLICRYLIDVDGWEPETAVNTFNDCRGHPIEASVYREDLISGATRSNLGIDQPPSDDTTIPMRRDSSDEEVSHPYSADRRKAIEAFMEARKRTEHQQTVRKIAAQNALRDEFGDFDARDKMQDFDARESMQDWRQMPLPMRDRSPDYHDIDFMNSMAGPRDRPFPPREAMDDCDFPGPFEHRERFFRGNMRDQDMMHPDEYRRMQYERRELRGGHPMEFGSDMYMENCDLEMGPRDMRENMDYDHGRQMGRFGNQPGPSRMFSEEDDFEDGPGGPMSRPFPGPFGHGGGGMSNDEIEEMEARRRFERNRAMKSQCAMDTDQRRSIDHGAHHREAAHMPGPMRSRPVDGPPNERMHPMGEGMRQMDERMRPNSDGMRSMDDRLHSVGDGMRNMGDGMRSMGEGMRGMGDGIRPMGEGMRGMSDGMRPMGEGMHGMGDGMRPMGEGKRGMGDGMRPMGEGMRGMGDGMRTMGDRGRPMSERMPPTAKGMYPMDEQMHPMNKRMRPMEERGNPMDDRMRSMDERMYPMTERMGSMNEGMPPKDARLPMNKPNSFPGPMRSDPMNDRNPRLQDTRKMPSEDLTQGGNRFAPYPSHMKGMQPNKERHGASMNYNYGMPNSNQNKQGYMQQSYPPGKMFN